MYNRISANLFLNLNLISLLMYLVKLKNSDSLYEFCNLEYFQFKCIPYGVINYFNISITI